jgi:hypothetical protein
VRSLFAAVIAFVAGCDGAITLEIAGDRPIPRALDAICVGVADTSESGGHHGQRYALTGELASLPQTLRIEPGDASSAHLWVRGDVGGAPVAWASTRTSFDGDVRLALEKCPLGHAGAPSPQGDAVGPADARLVASYGSGNLVLALGAESMIIDASGAQATASAGPPLPAGTLVAAIAIDVDGDCDDDVVLATDAEPPVVWRRDHGGFTPGAVIGTAPQAALAAADVNDDGAMDLVTGRGASLGLWYNDGSGQFVLDDEDLRAAGRVSAVSALALGDVNGDGNADLIVGQAGAPMTAWLGGINGGFDANDGVVPPVPLDALELTLADADGDAELDADLAVAVRGAAPKLYLSREGQLEDQSFLRLPRDPAPPAAHAIALGNWDASRCYPDAILAADAESVVLHGDKDAFTFDGALAAASDVVMIDVDEDGDLDAILATPEGVRWFAR